MKIKYHFTSPLCYLSDGNLVAYHQGEIIVLCGDKTSHRIPLPIKITERFLGWNNYVSRLLRIGVRAAIALDKEHILISRDNTIQEVSLDTGEVSEGWYCGNGIRALKFTDVTGVEGFEDGVYFGGYLGNNEKKPVNIYQRIGVDLWKVIYSFKQGEINHVHNIVADSYRNCLWVFTGDFGEAAAIWRVTDNFKNVERIACNDQKFRACVVYALPEGLLYATDAPFADDYIYLLNPDTMETKEVFPIHGSCIYGCKWKDKYVFSSTVEGDGRNMSHLEWLFTRKRGAGIKDDYAHIYIGNLKEGFKEIYKEKKDSMPYYTFQFGAFKFPAGVNNSDTLYFQPVATKKNDLRLMSLKWEDVK